MDGLLEGSFLEEDFAFAGGAAAVVVAEGAVGADYAVAGNFWVEVFT